MGYWKKHINEDKVKFLRLYNFDGVDLSEHNNTKI